MAVKMKNFCKQQSEYDCLLACITTFLQKNYGTIWPAGFLKEVEERKGTYGDDVRRAFEIAGINTNDYRVVIIPEYVAYRITKELLWGRRAIVQVRSINLPHAGHMVYWNGQELFDPSNKLQYYDLNQLLPEYVWIFNEVANDETRS